MCYAASTLRGLEGGGQDTPALRSQAGFTYGPWHGDRRSVSLFWIGWQTWPRVGLATLGGAVAVMLAGVLERLTQARPDSAQVTAEGPSR